MFSDKAAVEGTAGTYPETGVNGERHVDTWNFVRVILIVRRRRRRQEEETRERESDGKYENEGIIRYSETFGESF